MGYKEDLRLTDVNIKYGDLATLLAASMDTLHTFSGDNFDEILSSCDRVIAILTKNKKEFNKIYDYVQFNKKHNETETH